MTEREPDLVTMLADDELLDALGRGGSAATDEPVATLLAAWRADLDDDL
ncbi:anti-sigma-D factor RsdA, partial [Micromonospora zhanjiangensis]